MTKTWATTPLSTEDEAAYAQMQQAVVRHKNNPAERMHMLIASEGETPDFTTPKGRRIRSACNLRYLTEKNADCPRTLMHELTETMASKKCTTVFRYSKEDTDKIIAGGLIKSNARLRKEGIDTSDGLTAACAVDDHQKFSNTDFIFTTPQFHDANEAIIGKGDRFYVPARKVIESEAAWLSFMDWSQSYDRDRYAGNFYRNPSTDPATQSILSDFFIGQDIPKAMAVKAFQALKTAILINADTEQPSGFDYENTKKFLKNLTSSAYRRGRLEKEGNTLDKPLYAFTLTPKQTEFLTHRSPARDALVKDAVTATLSAMSEYAELKVPNSLSLEGGAVLRFNSADDPGTYTHFARDKNIPPTLIFKEDNEKHETHIIPKDPRQYNLPPKTQME